MQELWDCNALLGNRQALDEAWERDGFWFFRNVLDKQAVARLRAQYDAILDDYHVVEPGESEPVWSGTDVSNFPFRMEALADEQAWRLLLKAPAVEEFFASLLGARPFWIPIVVYRANPPRPEQSENRMDFIHQDGFYNQGIPFRICWIPLAKIDEPVGGLAIAPGMHRSGFFHDLQQPPKFPVPVDAISPDKWARADYEPGDILIFDLGTPHTGLANHSDRFRLSMDIRVMPESKDVPAIGAIVDVDSVSITIRDENGRERQFRIDSNTYCRDRMGNRFDPSEIRKHMQVADEVIVAGERAVASVIRPLSY